MLFWLSTVRAVVIDVPMDAEYASEESNLKITGVLLPFLGNHSRNLVRRFLYNFVLRDFSLATIEIVIGLLAIVFGVTFGLVRWLESTQTGIYASTGTVMLSALPIILGVQFLVGAFGYDVANVPTTAVHRFIERPPIASDGVPAAGRVRADGRARGGDRRGRPEELSADDEVARYLVAIDFGFCSVYCSRSFQLREALCRLVRCSGRQPSAIVSSRHQA